ncbi:MAG: Ig domain-containing protein [Bacteroidaceae bacterium]|nr:Ig domain-containing protein [Bacteroidaceae bacterium]
MKRINSFLLLLAAMAMTSTASAQVINGDLNHNDGLDVEDVTLLIDGYLTGATEQIKMDVEPYGVDNSLVSGTWYRSKKDKFRLSANGTTDYGTDYTYKFFPLQGCIVFYNSAGNAATYLKVFDIASDKSYLVVKAPGSDDMCTYRKRSTQVVKRIVLSATYLSLQKNVQYYDYDYLKASVLPSDAANTDVEWISSDKTVATVSTTGQVKAVAAGTAIITCAALDGSGVKATCEVSVGYYENDHEYIDLGLSVKWASMNIGASSPGNYGDYFAWGETEPKSGEYYWNTYKHCKYGSTYSITKYNASDGKTTLDSWDDAANVQWGGSWRMPTYDELDELKTKCMWTKTPQGFRVIGPNGNSILMPIAGYRWMSAYNAGGEYGYYWSSSLSTDNLENAACLILRAGNSNGSAGVVNLSRWEGLSVRPVCP